MALISQLFVIQLLITIISVINSHIIRDETLRQDDDKITIFSEYQELFNRTRRTVATTDKKNLWDEGIIPFEFDRVPTGSQYQLIKQAMREWEKSTCIKFVKRTPEMNSKYLTFANLYCGCCFAESSKFEHLKIISLANGCYNLRAILHELGHAIGFEHEHMRPDRDEYVKVLYQNIRPDKIGEFEKLSSDEVQTFNQTYDYYSVMHYFKNSYSLNSSLDTIIPKQKIDNRPIGKGTELSSGDIITTNLLYRCPKCGGTLFKNSGFFRSPINPDGSLVGIERCEWRIRAAEGERIELYIMSLSIYESPDCTVDYLEIRNGYRANSTVLARYCGTGYVANLIASNYLLVTFVKTSDKSIYSGFQVAYQTICGGNIEIERDTPFSIESTNYPDKYPLNRRCIWYFTAPDNHRIAMKINHFALEMSDGCKNDFLEIRDGNDEHAAIIGLYCGTKDSWQVFSTEHKLSVVFVSDKINQGNGFSATLALL